MDKELKLKIEKLKKEVEEIIRPIKRIEINKLNPGAIPLVLYVLRVELETAEERLKNLIPLGETIAKEAMREEEKWIGFKLYENK